MKEYYRSPYGCTASINVAKVSGRARLCVRVPQGDIVHSKTYDTYRGAKTAMGKYFEGMYELTGKEN